MRLKQISLNVLLKGKKYPQQSAKAYLFKRNIFLWGREKIYPTTFPKLNTSPHLCISSDCFMHVCLYLSCLPSLSSWRMESLIALPFLSELMFEKATRETKESYYLLTSRSIWLYCPCLWHLSMPFTGTKQALNMPYPLNTIKSCISFTWRQWLIDPSIWNSWRGSFNSWETQKKRKK